MQLQECRVCEQLIEAYREQILSLVIQKRVSDRFPEDKREQEISESIRKDLEKLEKKIAIVEEMMKAAAPAIDKKEV